MENVRPSAAPAQPAPSATPGARRNGAAGAAGSAAGAGDAATQPADAFTALLAALDQQDAMGSMVVADATPVSGAPAGPDDRLAEDSAALPPWLVQATDAATPLPAAVQAADAMPALHGLLAGVAGGLAHGLVAQTAQMDRAADRGAERADGNLPGAPRRASVAALRAAATALRGGVASNPEPLAHAAASTAPGQTRAADAGGAPATATLPQTVPAMAGPAQGERSAQALASATADALRAVADALRGASNADAASGAASAVAAPAPARPAEPLPADRTATAAAGPASAEGSTGQTAQTAGGDPSAAALAEGLAARMAHMEEQLSEQVAFWVNQQSQSAEMTVDQNGLPLEVRVTLQGNEAHVSFRSDQEQTRQALDERVAQLRELLQREGLQLAGVTVGSTLADGSASRRGGQDEPGGRRGQARVQAVGMAAADALPLVRPGAGSSGTRALDVFA